MLRRWAMDELTWKMFWIWLELNNLLLIYSGTLHLYVFVHVLYMYLLRYCTRMCVCVCVHTTQRSCASLFLSFGGKGRFVCTAAQSIAAVELLLLLLLLGSRRKKKQKMWSDLQWAAATTDILWQSWVVLVQVGFGVCKAIRAPWFSPACCMRSTLITASWSIGNLVLVL
jgi:hypothetical protein